MLQLRGGRMHYLKLIKLLYLVDRESLQRWGIPVTTDRYVSMDHGPVVSRIYSLIVEDKPKPQWAEYISAPVGDYEVELRKEAPTDKLSRAEEQLICEVFAKYGHMNRWKIVDYLHTLPEWQDPQGTSIPIHVRDILKAGGESEEEIQATLRELEAVHVADATFSRLS
jgi:uncharacterized phage-associated protein